MFELDLECGCKVGPPYLPMYGGDRHYTCEEHGYKYIIRSKIEKIIRFKIERK